MNYTTPEKVGISSKKIMELIQAYEKAGFNMHDILIARHGEICFETYWKPFHENFAHRMYSVTKSFVALAVGFLIQDGIVSLDDKITKYFPEEAKLIPEENMKKQTIRHTLMMASSRGAEHWMKDYPEDRVRWYFETMPEISKLPGTIFRYDSNGSFILGAMVERITGKTLIEYLREKLFDKLGLSENIECLKSPGGHAWGDSALIMPAKDLLKVAQFVMDKGVYNGEQILDAGFLTEATSKLISNNVTGENMYNRQGYGYQIWMTYEGAFSFNGMGGQFAICVPDKDMVFVCNADNQGIDGYGQLLYTQFFEKIVHTAVDGELPESEDLAALHAYADSLELSVAVGEKHSDYKDVIDGKEYVLCDNPMGITKCSIHFRSEGGVFRYTNKQGDKEIAFGMKKNVFELFPETGYSDEYGTIGKEGHQYQCAASAGWLEPRKLYIKVQIIDKYFGNLHIVAGFDEDNNLGLSMQRNAEYFLLEYEGYASGEQIV